MKTKIHNQVNETLVKDLREELKLMQDVYKCRADLLDAFITQSVEQTNDLGEFLNILGEVKTFEHITHEWFVKDHLTAVNLLNTMTVLIGCDDSPGSRTLRDDRFKARKHFWKYCLKACHQIYSDSKRRIGHYLG